MLLPFGFFRVFQLSLLVGSCTAGDYPFIFSTNTTIVQVGQPFTAKCQLNRTPPNGPYGAYIQRDGPNIIDYDFPGKTLRKGAEIVGTKDSILTKEGSTLR